MVKSILEIIAIFLFKKKIKGRGRFAEYFNLNKISIRNSYGLKLELNPQEYIDREVLVHGYYEKDVLNHIASAIKKTPSISNVLWDVGANIGLHSITIKKLYPELTVYAFEPYFYNFDKLNKNIHLNKLDIKSLNFGLSDKHDINQIFTSINNSGRTSFIELGSAYSTRVNTLSCSGDFLIKQFSFLQPTIIKVDVEGWEMNVLKGFKVILQSHLLHTIIFEGVSNVIEVEAVSFLQSHGFEVVHIPRTDHLVESTENYLATRQIKTRG